MALVAVGGNENPARVGDVIFIHGLGGDPVKTWSHGGGADTFWPGWLAHEHPELGVWSVGYNVAVSAWRGTAMPLFDRANNILAELSAAGLGSRPICFVAHSMGGLVVKYMLRNGDSLAPEFGDFESNVRGVIFFATPHTGSDLAALAKYLKFLLRPTIAVRDLERHAPALRELNLWYRQNADRLEISTSVFFETHRTKGMQVVDPVSADPGMKDVTPIGIDADHSMIVKPSGPEGLVYLRSRLFICRIFGISATRESAPDDHLAMDVSGQFQPYATEKTQDVIDQLGAGPDRAALLDELLYGVSPAGELPNSRQVNIYEIGVARSKYAENGTDPYIPRLDADSELDELIRTADHGRIILVVGPPNSGKSRIALQAVGRLDATLLAPKVGALQRLSALTIPALPEDRPIVLWLDDLERYLTGAGRLDRSALIRLSRAFPALTVLATLTSARYQTLLEEPSEIASPVSAAAGEDQQGEPARLGSDDPEVRALLDGARVVYVPADFVDDAERRLARRLYPQETFLRGPGVQFVAAREHDRFFATRSEADPVAWAIIMAAIDWGRVGLARPAPRSVLRSLSEHYLPVSGPDAFPSSDRLDNALRWAQERPVASPVKALTQVSDADDPSYIPFDYLAECADGRGPHRALQIPSATWRFAIQHAELDEILAVVSASERRGGGLEVLARAAERLQASERRELIAAGQLIDGVLLAHEGKRTAARHAFEAIAADAGGSGVVALTNLGALAELEGDWGKASTLYQKAAHASVLANVRLGRLFELRGKLPDAIQRYRAAANGGSAQAMAALGGLYRRAGDPAEAKKWYTDAAHTGHPGAMYALAMRAEKDGDQTEAANWLRRAAAAGNTYAMSHLAKRARERGDTDTALAWVLRAAEAGDSEAMKDAGDQARADGDIAVACVWYSKAGELDSPAIYELAKLAAAGEQDALRELTRLAARSHTAASLLAKVCVRKGDLDGAVRWYRAAAEMGDPFALRDLAVLASKGSAHAVDSLAALARGDNQAAASWLGQAAEAGSDDAEGALRDLYEEGHHEAGRQLTQALRARYGEAAALQWSRAAAESGAKWAMIETAELLIQTGDRVGAVTWYERAGKEESGTAVNNLAALAAEGMTEARQALAAIANAGSAAAALALGQLCDSQDVAAAVGWYKTAAHAGDRQAAMRLAQLAADETAALDALHDLADQGDPLPATLLGYLFLERDVNEAQLWFGKAARGSEPRAMIQLGHLAEARQEFYDATTWYRRAAELRYKPAMVALGRMLERDGNIDEAVDWYRRAADQSPDPGPDNWPEPTGEQELERLAATGHKAARYALAYLRREIWRMA